MSTAGPSDTVVAHQPRLADHSADRRMLLLGAMAFVVGTGGAASAWLLHPSDRAGDEPRLVRPHLGRAGADRSMRRPVPRSS